MQAPSSAGLICSRTVPTSGGSAHFQEPVRWCLVRCLVLRGTETTSASKSFSMNKADEDLPSHLFRHRLLEARCRFKNAHRPQNGWRPVSKNSASDRASAARTRQ